MKFNKKQQALFDKLTPLQQSVTLKKVADPSISDVEAYRRGGGKATSVKAQENAASIMLGKVGVQEFLKSIQEPIIKSSIMSREEILERLSIMGRVEITDLVELRNEPLVDPKTGEEVCRSLWKMIEPSKMPPGAVCAISEITASKDGLKFKMHDQRAAMKQLADMMGFNAPIKSEMTGANGSPINNQVVQLTKEQFDAINRELEDDC